MPDLDAAIPVHLRERAQWTRLARDVPALLAHPAPETGTPAPVVLWMHGRTVAKEVDPGRYLRWLRAGIGVCAVDLPGHGERFDEALQRPERSLEVVEQMAHEIDDIVLALPRVGAFDVNRMGIGGMSAGGMATILRLTRPHPFRCVSLEATTGSWHDQRHRAMFRHLPEAAIAALDPASNLSRWREIPLQAIHARHDEWVSFEGQAQFLDRLRAQYADPSLIEMVAYERTGAPNEHAGFGRMSADAKDRQRRFFTRWLEPAAP